MPQIVAAQPASSQNPVTRQARRLYVGGIAYGTNENALADFFNTQMLSNNLATAPGLPVLNAQINAERGFAFVELRSSELER